MNRELIDKALDDLCRPDTSTPKAEAILDALCREAVDEALEAAAVEIDGGPYSMKYITVQAATRIVRSHKSEYAQ